MKTAEEILEGLEKRIKELSKKAGEHGQLGWYGSAWSLQEKQEALEEFRSSITEEAEDENGGADFGDTKRTKKSVASVDE